MKLLHLYKSPPDDSLKNITHALAEAAEECHEVHLYAGSVDYRQVLELIFQHDRVICWW